MESGLTYGFLSWRLYCDHFDRTGLGSRCRTDELREVFYFHPFDIPKRVPLESFTIEGSESFRSVVVMIEKRDEHFKDKLAVSVVFEPPSPNMPHDLP